MARWWTADWHAGHANIIRFVDRPFTVADSAGTPAPDLHRMHTGIVDAVNDCVGPDDELWILGDLAMGDPTRTLPIMRRLTAGRLVLVAGNHDKVHPYATKGNPDKTDRWLADYRDLAGITEIHLTSTTTALADGTVVNVSHFPYPASDARPWVRRDGTVEADKFAPWRPVDDGRWLICGHVHEKWKARAADRTINVGLDAWAGLPVAEDTLVALIAAGPADHPADRWTAQAGARR